MASTTPSIRTRPVPGGRRRRTGWPATAGLLLLAIVPVAAGALRLTELASGPAVTPENARFVTMPLPVVVHIVAVTVYALLGAFQFSSGLRRRHRAWHRAAGTVLVPAGLATALTGLWMTAFYDLPEKDTLAVNATRYVVGTVMTVSLVLAVRALMRHDYRAHGAWMTRAYALAMGAGTQAVVLGTWLVVARPSAGSDETIQVNTVLMIVSWVLNALVAEWVIHRRRRPVRVRR